METKTEIILNNNHFNIVNKYFGDVKIKLGIERLLENVIILPYTLNINGYIEKVGILNECNPLRLNNFSDTLITGSFDKKETALECAKRELKEESGMEILEDTKWTFLGYLSGSKTDSTVHPCFSVDATDIKIEKKKGDGTEGERLSTFSFIPLSEAIKSNDAFVLSLIMKHFAFKNYLLFK